MAALQRFAVREGFGDRRNTASGLPAPLAQGKGMREAESPFGGIRSRCSVWACYKGEEFPESEPLPLNLRFPLKQFVNRIFYFSGGFQNSALSTVMALI